MSELKYTIANAEDRYWDMRKRYETLIIAIKEHDNISVVKAVKEWDEFEKREEEARMNWIKNL